MDRIWLKSYPPGVPAEIDTSYHASLADMLEQSFRAHANACAFVCMDRELSYAELDARSRHLAGWFQSQGLEPGDRIAVMLPNLLQYPVAIAAILRAGYVVVNVNPLYTARELAHQLADSGARAIVLLDAFLPTLRAVQAHTAIRHAVVTSIGEMLGARGPALAGDSAAFTCVSLGAAIAQGADAGFAPARLNGDDVAVLQYTGGTTGVSKGATLLHRNLIANLLQSEAWREPAYRARPDIEQAVTVVALPLYHIFGLTVCALLTMRCGGLGVLIPDPRDLPAMIRALRGYRIHSFPGVNTLYNALLATPGFDQLDFSALVQANGGGAAVQRAVADRWQAVTGIAIAEGYGLSETSPCVTANPAPATTFSGTVGLPLPSTELSIRDEAGRALLPGEAGEVCIRGPQVMTGYWRRPDETAQAFTSDGFFRTGDIGVMDARGFLRIVDRKKDMILVSGFNVYPNEIEAVAVSHPGVFEAAAVGVPDPHSGEAVRLFVVKKDPALTETALFAYCSTQLTGYKRPKSIEFRAELPKSNVGKILRRSLRDEAVECGATDRAGDDVASTVARAAP
ncbi:long-chain-fatty-acid--CoA ligase [Burkholderia stabilis]|uniref:Long-chain-fatty-acid--CoA ligase n=1 Tax=Burkholderia stabilis TaxID=95485 RepID=A0A4Q2AER5_9BURK|nr:long-chain-fatty-acid--CoA ligase [Burkholderia stabilis]